MADIQRFAQRPPRRGRRRRRRALPGGYVVDLQPKVVDAFLQATVAGFEYPRSDLAPSVRFVGPILAPPSARPSKTPSWWGELEDERPVVHVTQGGTLDKRRPGPPPARLTRRALARDDLLLVGDATGGPDPGAVAARPALQRAPRALHPPPAASSPTRTPPW